MATPSRSRSPASSTPRPGSHSPNLNANPGGEGFQTNLILPEPCSFLSDDFPPCSVVRPTLDKLAGAQAAVKALTDDGLFTGQSPEFFRALARLAVAADAARRFGF